MAGYLLDTSALSKHYHLEIGSARVDQILNEPTAKHFISRLTVLELQSVFAKKVRTQVIAPTDFQQLRRRFLTDISNRKLRVVRVGGLHFQEAERLLRQRGVRQNIRTLDALQLAVAIDLRRRGVLDYFVCADTPLGVIALAESLLVINPEQA